MEELSQQDSKYFYSYQSEGDSKLNEEKENFEKLPLASDDAFHNQDYPELKKINSKDDRSIPLYNAFPNKARKFNNIDKWSTRSTRYKREPTLFELVKRTLRRTNSHSPNGYIMTIMGGNICDVCDPYSELMQAAKFVSENTDDKKTLIVITRSCSDDSDTFGTREIRSENIPVYAKGKSQM